MILRRASSADANEVAGVLYEARTAHLPYALVHDRPSYDAWVAEVLLRAADVTVACEGSTIVGVLAIEVIDRCSWITQLYVRPGLVGRGIGSKLLRHALRAVRRPIRLQTFARNDGARRFYERHGFRAIAFSDGSANEERCPDVTYELA